MRPRQIPLFESIPKISMTYASFLRKEEGFSDKLYSYSNLERLQSNTVVDINILVLYANEYEALFLLRFVRL